MVDRYTNGIRSGTAMLLNDLMGKNKLTKYRMSKNSGIPYTTINDICSGKAMLQKCSAQTIYKIAKELNVSMETLLESCNERRQNFELFKSNVCHRVKALGDIDFIIEVLEKDEISKYYQYKWYPETLYLLAMLDYLSRLNDIKLCNKYDDIRHAKLSKIVYPSSVFAAYTVSKNEEIKRKSLAESIPEFIRFNIVESDVRNVI